MATTAAAFTEPPATIATRMGGQGVGVRPAQDLPDSHTVQWPTPCRPATPRGPHDLSNGTRK